MTLSTISFRTKFDTQKKGKNKCVGRDKDAGPRMETTQVHILDSKQNY